MCTSNNRFDKNYKIISNRKVCAGYFELKVETDNVTKHCLPGQFFMIEVPGVFLRRPLSVYDVKEDVLSFLYKVVGRGTTILSNISTGTIQLLGPLGKGYDLETYKNSNHIIVAGGTGIASVHFLAVKLSKKGTLYYGANSRKDLLCLDKFGELGWKIKVSTEDGSVGYKGYITDILQKNLKYNDVMFACGPTSMLKKVLELTKEKNVKGFASLEEKMACGLGNCQGCAAKIDGKTKMICKDGPVFKIEQVEL